MVRHRDVILPMSGMVDTAVGVESASNKRRTKKATKMLMPSVDINKYSMNM